jgi:hypothetical protein
VTSRWKDDDLAAFNRRSGLWTKEGNVRTHTMKGSEPRQSKYGNRRTIVDGISFHSKKEAARYQVLKLREGAKQISDLKHQVRFDIRIAGHLVCAYIADFTYVEGGKNVVEDAKGAATALYVLKKKLMKAVLGIEILET